jgi:hypothetical protein
MPPKGMRGIAGPGAVADHRVPLQKGIPRLHRPTLKTLRRSELAHHGDDVLVLAVDEVIEVTHVGGGEFAGEISKRASELGELRERGLANNGDGIVGRKIVPIVFEGDKAEGFDEAVGGVAYDDVDLMVDERAVDKARVHHVRLAGEMKIVAGAPAGEAIGALEQFVAEGDAPLGSEGREVGAATETEVLGIVAADDHDKSVFEAERLGDFEVEALRVLLPDALIDGGGIVRGSFVEDGRECSARVLDVKIEVTGKESFVNKERAAKVGLALDRDSGAGFDVLGKKLGKDDLLGEELRADDNAGTGRFAAGG